MKRIIFLLFIASYFKVTSQIHLVRCLPTFESNYSLYSYSTKETSKIKYAYASDHRFQFKNVNRGLALEFSIKNFGLGVLLESSKLAFGYRETNPYSKYSGIGFNKAQRMKLYYTKEFRHHNFSSYKEILKSVSNDEKNRSFHFGYLINFSWIKCKRLYGPPFEVYFINDTTKTIFIFDHKLINANAIGAGIGLTFSQYFKLKERWRLTLGYDQGLMTVINSKFTIIESGLLIHSNNISNQGSQFFISLQVPIIILK